MKVRRTFIAGVAVLEVEPISDDRGFFARVFCSRTLKEAGLDFTLRQASVSVSTHCGTLRGLHFQEAPHGEAKIVRCTRGSAFDVAVDVRPESATYLKWFALEISAENHQSLYIGEGCAHGVLTLTDNVELTYLINADYEPRSARGYRWDDPAIGVAWPMRPTTVSQRDQAFPWIG